ncbi:hypothetical protein Tco_0937538 [Tanacetum coccineum]|uniref:Uncharacterized protein n=1 Tax=Tanacetum coccineum TaxID=301880 RepID=A0ABQ5DFG6_9ASTR
MDGQGAGSCVMFGSAPSGPSFSGSPLVKLSIADRGGAGTGGSCVLIPDLVVMAMVGDSGFGVSLLVIVESIWDYHSRTFGYIFVVQDYCFIDNTSRVLRFGINKWYQSFALRNFDLEYMELKSTNSGPTAKLPILKLVTKMSTHATVEEKTNKKNDVKDRGLLLMALPNENQLTFSQYPYAKSMFTAIEIRFRGNAATKKTQKTLLKQQYENFSATSAESLDYIFNRLQKIVSRLAILGVIIAQEDLNFKFLSSLPPELNTHVVVWMNKPKFETISIDDLYNNFKIVEQKVKKTVGTSSGGQNLAFMTAPSSSSTNDANTACPQVSAASPSVNAAQLILLSFDGGYVAFGGGAYGGKITGSGPRCQDTILGDVNAQTRFEITSKQSIDPPLSRGYTLGSGEDSMKLIGIDGILLKLVLPVFVSAVKRMLMLPVQVSAVEGRKQPSKKAQRQEAEVPQDEAEFLIYKKQKEAYDRRLLALKKRSEVRKEENVKTYSLKRLRKVGMSRRVESSEDQESLDAPEDASK